MSETLVIDEDDAPRRRRAGGRERVMTDEVPEVEILSGESDQPTPEQALADAQKAIQERERQIAVEREARTRAEREAQRQQQGRAMDRGAVVAAGVEAASASKAQAISALRVARETGDLDAEIKAQEALSRASYRLEQAETEAARAKAAGPVDAAPGDAIPTRSQEWISRHPRFNSDQRYHAAMMATHYRLLADGIQADSPAYYQELDRADSEYDNGGRTELRRAQPEREMVDTSRQRESYNGAPPSRGGGDLSRSNTVQTLLGPVSVMDGGRRLHISPELMPDFEEGARISGMSTKEYVLEQVRIAREMKAGGKAGLISRTEEVYR